MNFFAPAQIIAPTLYISSNGNNSNQPNMTDNLNGNAQIYWLAEYYWR
jgi:hypothetical protein